MDNTTHEPKPQDNEPTSEQLSELSGGYEHAQAERPAYTDDATELNKQAAELINTNPDIRRRFTRILAKAGGATALTFLLAACGPNAEPAPTPTIETSTPTPEPSVEPVESTPTPEEPSITEYSISRESVARLIEMPVDQFSLESKQEQLKLVAFYMQGSDNRDNLPTFAKYYAATTDDPKDILPVISADNSFQEVATVMAYSKRYVYALTGDDREKFLIAALQNETSSGAYAPLKTVSDELPTTSPNIAEILAATNILRASTATGTSGMLSDETGTFQDITFQDGQTNRIYYHEIPVDTGVFKIWINK